MKVAIASVQVPFIRGGAEVLAEGLRTALLAAGHEAEIVTIPFKWYPPVTLMESMLIGRAIDLTEVNGERIDLVVALKFPAFYLRHPNKVLWLLHQHRQAYDLWGTDFGDLHRLPEGEFVRRTITNNDTTFLREARAIFTISQLVSDRLRCYNGLDSTPLYPPPANCDRLRCDCYEPFVFYPSRIDPMKRQRVLVEAARHLNSAARIVIAGGGNAEEAEVLRRMIADYGLKDRVCLAGRVPDKEKVDLYARCAAVYFGGYDEDYGYVPVEGFFSRKPVLTLPDSGEALQFVRDGENGYVVSDAVALAGRIDDLVAEPSLARRLGESGFDMVRRMNITWEHVVASLTRRCG